MLNNPIIILRRVLVVTVVRTNITCSGSKLLSAIPSIVHITKGQNGNVNSPIKPAE